MRARFSLVLSWRSLAAIISSLFFTVRATRDPLPNYRREDNHPDRLVLKRERPRRGEPCDYNTSVEYESRVRRRWREREAERGRESFLAKLLTALRISARETLARRRGPECAGQGRVRSLACRGAREDTAN